MRHWTTSGRLGAADRRRDPVARAGRRGQSEEWTMVDVDHEMAEEIVTHVKIEYCPS
ncbi:MAG: hypothetical protein H0U10_02600 [Chloroflexia bacterium]|nr:hypothetical protein [Chloroflexia bacterium]